MDPFRILLTKISSELTHKELQILIHIYNVPGAVRNDINSGLDLFNYMIKQDYISHEKIANLYDFMSRMKPARKDLLRKVEKYVEKEFKKDFREVVPLTLSDLSQSGEFRNESDETRSLAVAIHQEEVHRHEEAAPCCSISCCHHNCQCRCRNVPYWTIVLLLLLLIIATTVILCHCNKETRKPDNTKNDALLNQNANSQNVNNQTARNLTGSSTKNPTGSSTKNPTGSSTNNPCLVGRDVLIGLLSSKLVILFVVILFWLRAVMKDHCPTGERRGYTVLGNPTVQAPITTDVAISTGGLASPTLIPRKVPERSGDRPSPESAVFSFSTSGKPGSISTYGGTVSEPENYVVNSGSEA